MIVGVEHVFSKKTGTQPRHGTITIKHLLLRHKRISVITQSMQRLMHGTVINMILELTIGLLNVTVASGLGKILRASVLLIILQHTSFPRRSTNTYITCTYSKHNPRKSLFFK